MITLRKFLERYESVKDDLHIAGICCVNDIIPLSSIDTLADNMIILGIDRLEEVGDGRFIYTIRCHCDENIKTPKIALENLVIFSNINCIVKISRGDNDVIEFYGVKPISYLINPNKKTQIDFSIEYDSKQLRFIINVQLIEEEN